MLALFFRHFLIKLLILSKIVALFPLNFAPFSRLFALLAPKASLAQLPPSDQHVTSAHWLRVLCVDQDLNTERTEVLRDLSVEALKAQRP